MIRTESDLIALDVGTVVEDSDGFAWVRGEREHQWRGVDAPYPVLVNSEEEDEVVYLDDNLYAPSTVARDYGPFKVKETTND